MQQELLIVGAGITGSLTAALLARARPSLSLTVWDKARGAGGRISTNRDPAHQSLHIDMGAQYVSRFSSRPSDTPAFKTLKNDVFSELLSCRVLQPLGGKIEGERSDIGEGVEGQFVAPAGMNSIAKHYLGQSRAAVAYQHKLESIQKRGSRVFCETSNGLSASFDAVVLTQPIPQILSLHGNLLDNLDTNTRSSLEAVQYSSRYALGLVFETLSNSQRSLDWVMKYVDHPIIRFLSRDLSKRGAEEKDCELLLVHTSVPFAIEHLDTDKPHVQELIMAALAEVLPSLPVPRHTHLIRWRYSQVQMPYSGCPGFTELSSQPLVVAAGDGFVGSLFENCLRSAQSTTEFILTQLDQ